jgi:hypothetical protein
MVASANTSIPDANKGTEERVPYSENPKFFLRLLGTSKLPRIIFYVIAFVVVSALWYPNGVLAPIFAILVALEFGPWNWPRQVIWQGKKAVALNDSIADFLGQMGYAREDAVDGWFIWAGPQHLSKPWRSVPQLYTRFANGTFRLRGDRWALQRLQKLFDGERFKELSKQLRRK